MDLGMQFLFIGIALGLVVLNGFFVNAEFAIVKVRDTRIEQLMHEGSRPAKTAHRLVQNMDEYLSATQLGITLASLGLGWIGEPAFASIFQPILASVGLLQPALVHTFAGAAAFLLITFLKLVIRLACEMKEPFPATLITNFKMQGKIVFYDIVQLIHRKLVMFFLRRTNYNFS